MIQLVFASQSSSGSTSIQYNHTGVVFLFIMLLTVIWIIYRIARKYNKTSSFNAWRIDRLLLFAGSLFFIIAIFMDTSVPTSVGGRVHNIGLMNQKQNYILVSGFLVLIGVILNIANRKTNTDKVLQQSETIRDFTTKQCQYCAETIKEEAKICRFCGREQSA